MADRDWTVVRFSKLNKKIIEILRNNGFIKDFEVKTNGNKKQIMITLLYKDKKPAISEVKIVSRPGRRIYSKRAKFRPVLGNLGIAVVTTSKGVMTAREAIKGQVGGEVLFQVW